MTELFPAPVGASITSGQVPEFITYSASLICQENGR